MTLGLPSETTAESAATIAHSAYADLRAGDVLADAPDWRVERSFDCDAGTTGFAATSYMNRETGGLAIAFRGSDELLDFASGANMGLCQYIPNRESLLDHVLSCEPRHITVTGHSIGGALAQYLTYDLAREGNVDKSRLALYTFNGLGGVLGIERAYGQCDPEIRQGINATHFAHPHDLIPNIGGNLAGELALIRHVARGSGSFLACHKMRQFLASDYPGRLHQVIRRADRPYSISRTAVRAGPKLKTILALWAAGEELAAVRRVPGLLSSVSISEFPEVVRMAWAMTRRASVANPVTADRIRPAGG